MTRRLGHTHNAVAQVAREAASELYDKVMEDNTCYAEWRRQHPGASPQGLSKAFVEKNWSQCLGIAKATMAQLLTLPTISPAIKESIMEALILDSELQRGRGEVAGAPASRVLKAQELEELEELEAKMEMKNG